MNLDKLRDFGVELRKLPLIAGANVSQIARVWKGSWWADDETPITDPQRIGDLNKTLEQNSTWRRRNDKFAFLPIKALDCVAVFSFPVPPRKQTLTKCDEIVAECLKHAEAQYKATHDALTLLLNKEAFHSVLTGMVERSVASATKVVDGEAHIDTSQPLLSLMMLDLDHFKQINDTHGHAYGDLVLVALAKRLHQALAKFPGVREGQYKFEIGRLGGEEFAIALTGAKTKEDELRVAEEIRKVIWSDPLPTDDEWKELDPRITQGMQAPPLPNRAVSASIGVASFRPTEVIKDHGTAARRLLHEADMGSYRAKSGGRNVVRHFGDIFSKYGRILEHHEDTDIVTVDIGSNVGVRLASEFIVFQPDFCGEKKFVYSDGRTHRTLGQYPRVSCGRITVFDVQNEISFAKPVRVPEFQGRFKVGAHLESVPVGSINHLLTSGVEGTGPVEGLESLQAVDGKLNSLVKEHTQPYCAVCGIDDLALVLEERGSATVNLSLAKLYLRLRATVPISATFCQTGQGSICFVCDEEELPEGFDLESILGSAVAGLPPKVEFIAGVYSSQTSVLDSADKSKLIPNHAIAYARYALVAERSESVRVFNANIAATILMQSRQSQNYSNCRKDYFDLRDIGVDCAKVHNQMALACMDGGGDLEPIRKCRRICR